MVLFAGVSMCSLMGCAHSSNLASDRLTEDFRRPPLKCADFKKYDVSFHPNSFYRDREGTESSIGKETASKLRKILSNVPVRSSLHDAHTVLYVSECPYCEEGEVVVNVPGAGYIVNLPKRTVVDGFIALRTWAKDSVFLKR